MLSSGVCSDSIPGHSKLPSCKHDKYVFLLMSFAFDAISQKFPASTFRIQSPGDCFLDETSGGQTVKYVLL